MSVRLTYEQRRERQLTKILKSRQFKMVCYEMAVSQHNGIVIPSKPRKRAR